MLELGFFMAFYLPLLTSCLPTTSLRLPSDTALLLPLNASNISSSPAYTIERYDVPNTDTSLLLCVRYTQFHQRPLTELLTHASNVVDERIATLGETAYDPSGRYDYDIGDGISLHMRPESQLEIPRLDWGRIGDVVDGLTSFLVERRKFMAVPWFNIDIGYDRNRIGYGFILDHQ